MLQHRTWLHQFSRFLWVFAIAAVLYMCFVHVLLSYVMFYMLDSVSVWLPHLMWFTVVVMSLRQTSYYRRIKMNNFFIRQTLCFVIKMNFKCYYTFAHFRSSYFCVCVFPSCFRLSELREPFTGYSCLCAVCWFIRLWVRLKINMPHDKQNKLRTREKCERKSLHNVEIWRTDQIQLVCKFGLGIIADRNVDIIYSGVLQCFSPIIISAPYNGVEIAEGQMNVGVYFRTPRRGTVSNGSTKFTNN